MAAKIKKGDEVIVLTGKNKGKKGEVLQLVPKQGKAKVRGVNVAKRHTKPSQTNQGGIIDKELFIDVSNLAVVDPEQGKATKVGFKILEDGKKVRFAKLSDTVLDK